MLVGWCDCTFYGSHDCIFLSSLMGGASYGKWQPHIFSLNSPWISPHHPWTSSYIQLSLPMYAFWIFHQDAAPHDFLRSFHWWTYLQKKKKKFGSCWADANDIVGSLRTGEGSFHVGKATGKRQRNEQWCREEDTGGKQQDFLWFWWENERPISLEDGLLLMMEERLDAQNVAIGTNMNNRGRDGN